MVDPVREAGLGDSRCPRFATLQKWQARPPKQYLRVATQKKAKKNEAVDGMVRRRQRRWYWVVGESQIMRGEESQWLGFGRLGGAITHSTPVKAALISLVP